MNSTLSTKQSSIAVNHRRTKSLSDSNDELDNEILYLHKQYMKSKQHRKKTEMDYNLLSNKIKLLQNEENKMKTKEQMALKNIERSEFIRVQRMKDKSLLNQFKIKIAEKIKQLQSNSTYIKKERESSVKAKKYSRANSQKDLLCKIRNERKKDYETYLENKQKELNRKREMVKMIKTKRSLSIENKRKEEINKKIQMKKELLMKIMEEDNKAKQYEDGVNNFHTESIEIMNRIKLLTESS